MKHHDMINELPYKTIAKIKLLPYSFIKIKLCAGQLRIKIFGWIFARSLSSPAELSGQSWNLALSCCTAAKCARCAHYSDFFLQ